MESEMLDGKHVINLQYNLQHLHSIKLSLPCLGKELIFSQDSLVSTPNTLYDVLPVWWSRR